MRRINFVYTIACVALVVIALESCTRSNGIDNNQVITKPYTLYFVDTNGVIYNTNDGDRIALERGPDGLPASSLHTSGQNLLMRKRNGTNLFVSDGGHGENLNFNPNYKSINPAAFGQNIAVNIDNYVDDTTDRLYVASNQGAGVVYNDSNGNVGSVWLQDSDDGLAGNSSITSYAYTRNGKLFAFDDVSRNIYMKENKDAKWVKKGGGGLPASGSGRLYIGDYGNNLIMTGIEAASDVGVWYSSNDGDSWDKYTDIKDAEGTVIDDITAACAPFGKVVIATTLDNGVWRFSGESATWEYSSFGLEKGTRIYAITAQRNVFKNEAVREYVFIATSTGVYRSDDLGQNWIRIKEGIFTAIF